MLKSWLLGSVFAVGLLLGEAANAESLPAIALEPGAATRTPNYDHGGYYQARSPSTQTTNYYFGDYGYYGYPWGYYYDVGTLHPQAYYIDRGYPYNNGTYFYSSPHPQRGVMPSQRHLQ